MKKWLSGWCPRYRRAFELSRSDAMYNWDWPEKLYSLAPGQVVPMVINNADSIERFRWWAETHSFDDVLWHNEPPLPNIGAAVKMAEWTNAKRAELIAGGSLAPGHQSIVGNFLIRPGTAGAARSYDAIDVEIGWFMEALDFPAMLGIHLYADDAEKPDAAIEWHTRQLDMIRADYDTFAVTEWGDLTTLWRAGQGPDIGAYSAYMRQCWEAQKAYDVYASAWYVGCASSSAAFKGADYVLSNQDGTLRPLGVVWRDLDTGGGVIVEPPKPGTWETMAEWTHGGDRWQARRQAIS